MRPTWREHTGAVSLGQTIGSSAEAWPLRDQKPISVYPKR